VRVQVPIEVKGFLMETLIVDAEGKVTIPPEFLHKRGLRPGDAVALIESAEGLLVYHGGVDPQTLAWWQALSDEDKQRAAVEARHYEALSDAERDALWNEGAETLEADAEDDERELPAS
jgi:bifunctional DNA-binding transcriptional regulator/antitoxin component of YhaV-PrlF toxin-antitoxin module